MAGWRQFFFPQNVLSILDLDWTDPPLDAKRHCEYRKGGETTHVPAAPAALTFFFSLFAPLFRLPRCFELHGRGVATERCSCRELAWSRERFMVKKKHNINSDCFEQKLLNRSKMHFFCEPIQNAFNKIYIGYMLQEVSLDFKSQTAIIRHLYLTSYIQRI